MKGCGNYCSYCVVPFVRGPERSIDDALILDECAKMAESGAKEIIFLGQNVNSYNYKGLNFSGLIKKAAQIPDILRIRCMTNHPKDLSDELIETMALEPKLCKHIHLPMQSASDKILEKMNRKYTYSHYLKLIEKLRKSIDDISITTDIIVGFPGEQEEDFEKTLKAVKDIRFGGLYVFRYSPRPNTKAAELIDDIPIEEKQRRLAVILKESNDISAEIVSQMTGTVQEVLFEKYENGNLEARTGGGRKVFVKGGKQYLGKKIAVLIKEAKINSLFGEIL
jgi:tRNA-2-methylthio-N6-dimethylallyladenosine synthase